MRFEDERGYIEFSDEIASEDTYDNEEQYYIDELVSVLAQIAEAHKYINMVSGNEGSFSVPNKYISPGVIKEWDISCYGDDLKNVLVEGGDAY